MPIAKIFTVSKNETDLIENFILYHGKIFGFKNIVVIDNGSTCPHVLSVYKKYVSMGMVLETEYGYHGMSQGEHFTKYMKKHSTDCEFIIGLDTDEFFYHNPVSNILLYLKSLPKNITKLKVSKYMNSIPDRDSIHYIDQKVKDPVANINTFLCQEASPPKYFFRARTFISTVNGCHNGKVSRGITQDIKDIYYFHFHSTGNRRSVERARSIVCGYNYTNVNSPISTQLEDLINVPTNSPGTHRVLEYGMFLNKTLTLTLLQNLNRWPLSYKSFELICKTFPTVNGLNIDVIRENSSSLLSSKPSFEFDNMIFYDIPIPKNIMYSTSISQEICDFDNGIKKVAIMLSGHMRNFSRRIKFWKEFVSRYSNRVDFYIHTWNESGTRDTTEWIALGKCPPMFEEIKTVFRPNAILVENHEELFETFSFSKQGLPLYYVNFKQLEKSSDFTRNIGSQLYSIMKCHQLVLESGNKYDIIMRLRSDAIIENFGNIFTRPMQFIKNRRDVLVINGSKNHSHPGGGRGCSKCDQEYFYNGKRIHESHENDLCDIFYYGTPDVMAKICNLFNDVSNVVESFRKYNNKAIRNKDVSKYLKIHSSGVIGITNSHVYENKLKGFYPERLIREYMKNFWTISDPLGLEPRILY